MLTTCIPILHCNTHAPGWLFNGTHPEMHEGIVPRRVCFHWSNDCCYFKTDIKVRSCGSFYAYELGPPSACQLRYCGEWRSPQLYKHLSRLRRRRYLRQANFRLQCKRQVPARVTYKNFTCKLMKILLFSFLNSGFLLARWTCSQQWRGMFVWDACIIEGLNNATLVVTNIFSNIGGRMEFLKENMNWPSCTKRMLRNLSNLSFLERVLVRAS